MNPILPPPLTPQRIRKAWGWTTEVYDNAHFLEVEAGGFCSIHVHHDRANVFAVHNGKMEVEFWMGIKKATITLTDGMTYCVPSLVVHRFRCPEETTCSEYYYADRGGIVDRDDIQRFSEGGITLQQQQ